MVSKIENILEFSLPEKIKTITARPAIIKREREMKRGRFIRNYRKNLIKRNL